MPDDDFAYYLVLRRKADGSTELAEVYWEYRLLLQDPSRVPEVEFSPDEMEKIGAANLNKVKLVRCLSSL